MEAPPTLSVQRLARGRSFFRRALPLLCLAYLGQSLLAPNADAQKVAQNTGTQKTGTQKQKQEQLQKSKKVLTPIGEVRVLDKAEAREAVNALKKHVLSRRAFSREELRQLRNKDRSAKVAPSGKFLRRLEEVEKIQKLQHESLVAPLAKIIEKDPALAVRSKAATALRAQPAKPATRAAEKLLGESELRKQGSVAGPLLELLAYHGAKQRFWDDVYDDFLDFGTIAQVAICKAIGQRKDWSGLDLLLEHLDAPAPVDVHAADNPPESYWKARWEAWQAFKPDLVKSLKELLGKEFYKREQAEEWIQEQGGIRRLRRKRKG